jgi:hypothetical protein
MSTVPVLPYCLLKISLSIVLLSMPRGHEKTINVYTSNCVWQQFITNCTFSFVLFSSLYKPLHNLFCFCGLLVLSVTIVVLWRDWRWMFLHCHTIFLVLADLWRSTVSRSSWSSSPRGVFTHEGGGSRLPKTSVTTHQSMPLKTPAHFNRHKCLCGNVLMGRS